MFSSLFSIRDDEPCVHVASHDIYDVIIRRAASVEIVTRVIPGNWNEARVIRDSCGFLFG